MICFVSKVYHSLVCCSLCVYTLFFYLLFSVFVCTVCKVDEGWLSQSPPYLRRICKFALVSFVCFTTIRIMFIRSSIYSCSTNFLMRQLSLSRSLSPSRTELTPESSVQLNPIFLFSSHNYSCPSAPIPVCSVSTLACQY